MSDLIGIEGGILDGDLDLLPLEQTRHTSNEEDAELAKKNEVHKSEQPPPEYNNPPSYEVVLWSEKLKIAKSRPRTLATSKMYTGLIKELGHLIRDPISTEECFKSISKSVNSIVLEELQSRDFVNPAHLDGWQTWITRVAEMAIWGEGEWGTFINVLELDDEIMKEGPGIIEELFVYNAWVEDSFKDAYGIDTTASRYEPRELANLHLLAEQTRAMLELCPRKAIVDDWLLHQIQVCQEWFLDKAEPLTHMPETKFVLRKRWTHCLWNQWTAFMRNGFDAELAAVWKADLFYHTLGMTNVENVFEYGQLPRLPDEFRQHWYETDLPVGYLEGFDLRIVCIEGKRYFSPEGGSGDIISYVPPKYTSKIGGDAKPNMLDVVSYILHLQSEQHIEAPSERSIEGLEDLISRSDLELPNIKVLEWWIRQWKAHALIEQSTMACSMETRTEMLQKDLMEEYYPGRGTS
ncbi:hypothetical protein BLS_005553 [Venturia inaequalis]|uniref:Uncharacterized protein n=1 Tax=Venturia inaequalis TaxID=5025 RepID=A0A8H3UF47_VENIN|nr:hypothetical protein BLS_005553 [Venturia inaequalis]